MNYLVLIRHGESTWNEKGLWTGFVDIDLDEHGIEQAKNAAKVITDIHFDVAYCSVLRRAIHTMEVVFDFLQYAVPIYFSEALNERNYGIYTGKNKWEIEKEVGEKTFEEIRRGWDFVIPKGESLQDVHERVTPYYVDTILPEIKNGKNVFVSLHGNSMRALVKYLENISDKDIEKLEIATGEVYVYQLDTNGNVVKKEIRAAHDNTV